MVLDHSWCATMMITDLCTRTCAVCTCHVYDLQSTPKSRLTLILYAEASELHLWDW